MLLAHNETLHNNIYSSSQESLGGLTAGASVWGGAGSGASPGLPRGMAATASAVSIASMHQQKKRGIKSSLGRLFSKKDKAGMPVSVNVCSYFIVQFLSARVFMGLNNTILIFDLYLLVNKTLTRVVDGKWAHG